MYQCRKPQNSVAEIYSDYRRDRSSKRLYQHDNRHQSEQPPPNFMMSSEPGE